MTFRIQSYVLVLTLSGAIPAKAATIYLANSLDGSGTLNVGTYPSTAWMDIRLDTASVDTLKVAFVYAVFDSTREDLFKFQFDYGQRYPFVYDCEFCDAPDPLDSPSDVQLNMGDGTPGGGFPLGAASYLLAALELGSYAPMDTDALVTFEQGVRKVTLYSSAPTYFPFVKAPDGFPEDVPITFTRAWATTSDRLATIPSSFTGSRSPRVSYRYWRASL